MNTCPYCQATTRQVKAGLTQAGSQRVKCQHCGHRYTPMPKEHGYPDTLRQQAVRLYVDGNNYRRIARQLGVDHKSIMPWVKAYTDQVSPAPVPAEVNNAELDELFTFVQKKKTAPSS